MPLQRQAMIKEKVKDCMRSKLKSYRPETSYMPFHHRLLGKERMALYSFIQSLNTTFGISIYEPITIALASKKFSVAKNQVKPVDQISSEAHQRIVMIMDELVIASRTPNKSVEIEEIRKVSLKGTFNRVKLTKVNIWLENHNGELFLIDLKTTKPSFSHYERSKRTFLEWTAAELARDPQVVVNTIFAVPYNPYEPEPYERWMSKGMLDLDHEVLIAEEFWDFIGGEGTYTELLDAFEQAGIELRDEIDEYFKQFS